MPRPIGRWGWGGVRETGQIYILPLICMYAYMRGGFPDGSVKNLPANTGDVRDAGSIPGLGRSPGEGLGNPLQYVCLENRIPMDRGTWHAIVHRSILAKSQTRLKPLSVRIMNV